MDSLNRLICTTYFFDYFSDHSAAWFTCCVRKGPVVASTTACYGVQPGGRPVVGI